MKKQNITILCVDNEEDILAAYKDIFTRHNNDIYDYKLLCAKNGEEAVRHVQREVNKYNNIPVVFLGINTTEDTDDSETMKRILELDPDILSVVITANTDWAPGSISSLFQSPDQWILLNKPFSEHEIERMAFFMVNSWYRRRKSKAVSNLNIRIDKELKVTRAQLIQTDKLTALGELSAGVAHELNQPLNGIKIICQSILRDIDKERFEEEELEQDLTDIVGQVNKMAEIIDHMRIFTRNSTGTSKEKINLNDLIENPFKIIGQQLKNYNIEIIRNINPDLPNIMGDPICLEQVFMNLITNARRAFENCDTKEKKIEISTNKIDEKMSGLGRPAVVGEIKDNGVGIPKELHEKIFQPFFTTSEPGQGTGLGLSVSAKIIKEHKGRIEVYSELGKGTTFRVILPVYGNS